jgi:hypothetical protein
MLTRKFFLTLLFCVITLISIFNLAYSGIPNTSHPATFLGPTLKMGYIGQVAPETTYSFAGEAGVKNFRFDGTFGWYIQNNQRAKISAEYLIQKITYAFFSGNTDQWMNQGALGLGYQYDFNGVRFDPQLEVTAFVSHAPSKTLSTVTGSYLSAPNVVQFFVDARRIAGSNAAGVSPGITFQPMIGGVAGINLNYDNVRYDTRYTKNEDAKGFGGTVHWDQAIGDNFGVGLLAAFRQPFNNYQANVTWMQVPRMENWVLGLEGEYTVGKNTLPNTYNVSLTANYDLDNVVTRTSQVKNKDRTWMANSAAYMPQVLAIADERVAIAACTAIHYTGPANPLAPLGAPVNTPFTFSFANLFDGSPIVFSIAVIPNLHGDGGSSSDFSINPNTGLLSYGSGPFTLGGYTVTVTGINSCSSASVTFTYDNG